MTINEEKLKEILQELNFKSLINRFIKSELVTQVKSKNQSPSQQPSLFDLPSETLHGEVEIVETSFESSKTISHEYILCDTPESISTLLIELSYFYTFTYYKCKHILSNKNTTKKTSDNNKKKTWKINRKSHKKIRK